MQQPLLPGFTLTIPYKMKITIGLLIAFLVTVLVLVSNNCSPAGKLHSAAEARNRDLETAESLLP